MARHAVEEPHLSALPGRVPQRQNERRLRIPAKTFRAMGLHRVARSQISRSRDPAIGLHRLPIPEQ